MPDRRDKQQAKMRARKHQKQHAAAGQSSHEETMRDDMARNDSDERSTEESDHA